MSDPNHSAAPAMGGNYPKPAMYRTEFEEKYPPDREPGKELADTARVWKVYRGQAIEHDDSLLRSWNDTVNILLTFAGLFSAAVTSFVLSSADDLKPDPNAYVANILFTMFNSSAGNPAAFAGFQPPPSLTAAPTSLSRVVNGLWFISLFLSLAAALLCILVKQWLDQYVARTRSTAKHPRQWAQRREFYFHGLSDWNVAAIISVLPLLLHIALFFFLVGLTTFLWQLDRTIAGVLLSLVILLFAVYLGCFVLPLWSDACPYATPLLNQLIHVMPLLAILTLKLWGWMRQPISYLQHLKSGPPGHGGGRQVISEPFSNWHRDSRVSNSWQEQLDSRVKRLRDMQSRRPFDRVLQSRRSFYGVLDWERNNGQPSPFEDHLECDALIWLIRDVSEDDSVAVAWQSLGALLSEIESPRELRMREFIAELPITQPTSSRVCNQRGVAFLLRSTINLPDDLWLAMQSDGALDDLLLARVTRSWLWTAAVQVHARRAVPNGPRMPISADGQYRTSQSPDAVLVYAVTNRDINLITDRPWTWWTTSSTITSVASALLAYCYSPADTDFIVALIICSSPSQTPKAMWQRISQCLGCPSNHGEEMCAGICVVNALVDRALSIHDARTCRDLYSCERHSAFSSFSHIQLVIRIMVQSQFPVVSAGLSPTRSVWKALTRRQNWPKILSFDVEAWSDALSKLSHDLDAWHDAEYAAPYMATWLVLMRGPVLTHARLYELATNLSPVGPDIPIVCLRHLLSAMHMIYNNAVALGARTLLLPALRSFLELLDASAIALNLHSRHSVDLDFSVLSRAVFHVFFVTNMRGVDEDEREHLKKLLARTIQHCIPLDPDSWRHWCAEGEEFIQRGGRSVWSDIMIMVKQRGPCTEGTCADKDVEWPAELLQTAEPRVRTVFSSGLQPNRRSSLHRSAMTATRVTRRKTRAAEETSEEACSDDDDPLASSHESSDRTGN